MFKRIEQLTKLSNALDLLNDFESKKVLTELKHEWKLQDIKLGIVLVCPKCDKLVRDGETTDCNNCDTIICISCRATYCEECNDSYCASCASMIQKCMNCKRNVCTEYCSHKCEDCENYICEVCRDMYYEEEDDKVNCVDCNIRSKT